MAEDKYDVESRKYSKDFQQLPKDVRDSLLQMMEMGIVKVEIDERGEEIWSLVLNDKKNSISESLTPNNL